MKKIVMLLIIIATVLGVEFGKRIVFELRRIDLKERLIEIATQNDNVEDVTDDR